MLDEKENAHVVVFQDCRLRHARPVVKDGIAAYLGIAVTDHSRNLDRKVKQDERLEADGDNAAAGSGEIGVPAQL